MIVKLVRDRQEALKDGRNAPANSLPGRHMALCKKLFEEAAEIDRDPTDAAEYADLLEAMLELARLNGVRWSEIEAALLRKREEKGGFRLGLVAVIDEVKPEPWCPGTDPVRAMVHAADQARRDKITPAP